MSLNSKMAGESLILYPLGLESPAIHKVTVHPTGKHSLQAAITFDCISLHNLETLFIQPKTLQSSGRAGSIESMWSDSFLPKAIDMFWFFEGGAGECYKDKCRYITWEHKVVGVTTCTDLKKASWGIQTSNRNSAWQKIQRSQCPWGLSLRRPLWLFHVWFCVTYEPKDTKAKGEKSRVFSNLCSV